MGYNDEKRDIKSLITIGANGINVPTFVQIRDALIQEYKDIWGTDIDTDTSCADGQFIHDEANMINNIMLALNKVQSQMNPNTATGTMLDTICAFSGVMRERESASYCDMYVKYVGPRLQFVSNLGSGDSNVQKIVLVDKNNKTWSWQQSKISDNEFDTIFVPDQIYYLRFTCDEIGPNAAEAGEINFDDQGNLSLDETNHGFIYQTIDSLVYPFQVWQQYDAVIGSFEESDQSLRSRRIQSRSDNGISTLSGLKGSLESLGGVKEVKIYNNNSINPTTAKDGTDIEAHSVYICIRYEETNLKNKEALNSLDPVIGETIYNKLTPGVMTTAPALKFSPINREYDYSAGDSVPSTSMKWKLCAPVTFSEIVINIVRLDTYNKAICEAEITKNCKAFASSISLDSDLSMFDLIGYLNQNSTLINNKTPYFCKSGYIDTANNTLLENTDGYFDFNHFIVAAAPENSWCKVTLLGADKAEISNTDYPDMICYKSGVDNYIDLLTTVGDIFTTGSGRNWGDKSLESDLYSLQGTQFNNQQPDTVDFKSQKIVYYTGPTKTDSVTYSAQGGGSITINLNVKQNNYYIFKITSKKISGGIDKYYLSAQAVTPYNGATFTYGDSIKSTVNFNSLADDEFETIIDTNHDNKFLFKEGSLNTDSIEFRDLYFHYVDADETTLTINTTPPNNE